MKFLSIFALVSISAITASQEASTVARQSSDVFTLGGLDLSDNTKFDENGFFKLNPEAIANNNDELHQNARPKNKDPFLKQVKQYFATSDPIDIATQRAEFPLGSAASVFGSRQAFRSGLRFFKRKVARTVDDKVKPITLKHKKAIKLLCQDLADFLRGKEERWHYVPNHFRSEFKKSPLNYKKIHGIFIFFEASFNGGLMNFAVTCVGEVLKHNAKLGKIILTDIKSLEQDYPLFTDTLKDSFNKGVRAYQ